MIVVIVLARRQVKRMYVHLQPLIDEFKKLWVGIGVYYVSRPIPLDMYFMLYGIRAYTKHDSLGLGVFSSKHVD